ncbi:MAG TPA: hypothetical protein VKZ18_14460 [Polyangia bacterium]|nr:hypothetical protein [Polyangia bacterium]
MPSNPDFRPAKTKPDGGSGLLIAIGILVGMGVVIKETMAHGPAFLAGAVLSWFGLFAGGLYLASRHRRRSVEGVPLASIATLPEGLAKVRGRIVAGGEGLVVSPCRGDSAVWAEITTTTPSGEDSDDVVETASRDFFVEDESGARASIASEGADVISEAERIQFAEFSPSLVEYLSSRPAILSGREYVSERLLRPGDVVVVVGEARRRGGEVRFDRPRIAQDDTFADSPKNERVMRRIAAAFLLPGLALLLWSIAS